MLMRNRIFVTEGGIAPVVATFNARADLVERRAVLLERGLLLPQISTPNIYDHYRNTPWGDTHPTAEPLRDLSAHKTSEEYLADGTPFRVVYGSDALERPVYDYQRADGSTYLRIPQFIFKEPSTWPTSVQRVAPDGTVSGEFKSVAQWFKRFVRVVCGEERSFVFIDSRFSAQHLVPMRAGNIHIVYVLHNIHLAAPRLWSSDHSEIYGLLMDKVDGIDAFVTLTERQRDDIAQRRGPTSNLFVVPNPVDMPEPDSDRPPRDPNRVTVVARLERQKRLGHAIRAFARAVERVPAARLDIYGSGSQMPVLEKLARRQGVADSVTLHGHDPQAREALWRSSAFLMTSLFEGYPLSTLESLSHGCPVISYDIKYGPREQITDGVDGYLVPNGGIRPMADRIVELLTDPGLVETMSRAALDKARHHGHLRFLDEWRAVLEKAVELKPLRTRVDDIRLEVTTLSASSGPRRRGQRSARPAPVHLQRDGTVRFAANLQVTGHSKQSSLQDAAVTLAAVHLPTGRCVDRPLSVTRVPEGFLVSSNVLLHDVLDHEQTLDDVRLRLRFVWQNSSWDTYVTRPAGQESGVDVVFGADDTLQLNFR